MAVWIIVIVAIFILANIKSPKKSEYGFWKAFRGSSTRTPS